MAGKAGNTGKAENRYETERSSPHKDILSWETPREDEEFTLCDIQQRLQERYSRQSHVLHDNEGPCSYAYYDEDKESVPTVHQQFPVINIPNYEDELFDEDVVSKWQSLGDKAKHDLFLILYGAKCIFTRMIFSIKSKKWEKRTNYVGKIQKVLKRYGARTEGETGPSDVLTYLAGGNVAECLQSLEEEDVKQFYGLWLVAFIADLMNGHAHVAVIDLMTRIKKILLGVAGEEFPSLWVWNVTSPTVADHMSTSSSSASVPNQHNHGNTRESVEKQQAYTSTGAGTKRRRVELEDAEKRGGHSIDLAVVCLDNVSGQVYYLLLIAIFSHPKSMHTASMKFKEEIIHVLQSQPVVFAILFGTKEVILYKAERMKNGEIYFSNVRYNLLDTLNRHQANFDVASFQRMVMDILCCLIQSIREIGVGKSVVA